jgi:hypothetical protein
MAKKTKTESVLSRETRTQANAPAPAKPAPEAVVEATAPKQVAKPVPKVAGPKRAKKARFVREKKEQQTPVKTAGLPARSTKAAGKMMTRNVKAEPKAEQAAGQNAGRVKTWGSGQ